MSTITVVKKNGYAAIAADTLTKWGYSKEPADYVVNHEKIIKVGSNYIGVAGSVTTGLALKAYFSKLSATANLNSVDKIFHTWNKLHRVLKEEYFLNASESDDRAYESSRMDALIANPYGIFGVGPYRSVQEFTKFYSYGRGSDYAQGAMYAIYDADESAEGIARVGVQAAAEFDEDSGLPITSYAIKLRK
jgi:ATP-dependent HslUV protease subunit HslV